MLVLFWSHCGSWVVLKPFWRFKLFQVCFPLKRSLNCQNGFRTTLERLSCHNDFKITQAQTKVSFFHLNPLLQVEFRAILEPFSYTLLNGSNVTQYCHICKSQTTSGLPVVVCSSALQWRVILCFSHRTILISKKKSNAIKFSLSDRCCI